MNGKNLKVTIERMEIVYHSKARREEMEVEGTEPKSPT